MNTNDMRFPWDKVYERDLASKDGYHIVVVTEGDETFCLSRRGHSPDGLFTGDWRLLDETEAHQLACAYNNDPREGGHAQVVEVYRFDKDPVWKEGLTWT